MINKTLVDYMSEQLKNGSNKTAIKSALLAKGWQEQDIDDSYASIFGSGGHAATPIAGSAIAAHSTTPTTQLPGAPKIFGEAWQVFTQRLWTYLGIVTLPIAAMTGFGLLAAGSLFIPGTFTGANSLKILIIAIFAIAIALFQIWSNLALIYAIKDSGENIGVKEAYRRAFPKVLSAAWISFLMASITISTILLTLVPVAGFIAYYVVSIFFTVWFSFSFFVLVNEDTKGLNALLTSRAYAKPYMGALAWRYFFLGLLAMGFFIVVFGLMALAVSIAGDLVAGTINIIATLIVILLMPLVISYAYLLYTKVKHALGEFSYVPENKTRIGFTVLSVVGLVSVFIMVAIMAFALLFAVTFISDYGTDIFQSLTIFLTQAMIEISYEENRVYPSSLDELVPEYLDEVPIDPVTHAPYEYQVIENGLDYELCYYLPNEEQERRCANKLFEEEDFAEPASDNPSDYDWTISLFRKFQFLVK